MVSPLVALRTASALGNGLAARCFGDIDTATETPGLNTRGFLFAVKTNIALTNFVKTVNENAPGV